MSPSPPIAGPQGAGHERLAILPRPVARLGEGMDMKPTDDDLEAMAVTLEDRCDSGEIAHQIKAAAMLRACKGRVRYSNCCKCGRVVDTWEESEGGDPHGCELASGEWVCSEECFTAALALEPARDHAGWNAGIEAAAKVAKSLGPAFEYQAAATAIRQLKKGNPND